MTDLCKEALIKLVDSNDPITLNQEAKEVANKTAKEQGLIRDVVSNWFYGQKLPLPEFHHPVTEYKGWKIVQHNTFHHYVMLDSDGKIRAQHWEPDWRNSNFKIFLEVLISLSTKYGNNNAIMNVFEIITGENSVERKGRTVLRLTEAEQKYPNTKNLAAGFYTNHPSDEKALTPIENYYTNLAINQDDERGVLLGKMGAKSVEIERINISKKEDESKGNANISVVKAEIGVSLARYFRESTHLRVEFEGNVVDIDKSMLEKSVWFRTDSEMQGILNLRLDSTQNKVIDRCMESQISERFRFDFHVAANILNKNVVDIQNEYENATKIVRRFHVIFPKKS